MANTEPMPQDKPIAITKAGESLYMESGWLLWLFNTLVTRLGVSSARIGSDITLTNQSAAIGATPIPSASLSAGLYRVSYYARITTPASISSSLTVTLNWTESGLPLTLSGQAMTGNSTTTVQTGTQVVKIDGATSLSYSTAYASNAAGMVYSLSIVAEQLP